MSEHRLDELIEKMQSLSDTLEHQGDFDAHAATQRALAHTIVFFAKELRQMREDIDALNKRNKTTDMMGNR